MTTEALVPAAGEPAVATGRGGKLVLPQVIIDAGPSAVARFLEFFAGRIANARTRAAYGRAVGQFLGWCEARGLGLRDVSPLHVAAYIRTHPGSAPTVKQHLAAIRMLGDWLVVNQVLPVNPAAAVRGPKHVVTKGATPVLSPAEARKLLESTDTGALAGLRDRALLSVMLYSFARVSAVLGMRRQDYFGQGSRGWLRLHEKGGKRHDVPAHHRAAAALDAYVEAGGLAEPKAPLFQSVDPAGRRLTGRALDRRLVLAMIKRRAAAAGLPLRHETLDGHPVDPRLVLEFCLNPSVPKPPIPYRGLSRCSPTEVAHVLACGESLRMAVDLLDGVERARAAASARRGRCLTASRGGRCPPRDPPTARDHPRAGSSRRERPPSRRGPTVPRPSAPAP